MKHRKQRHTSRRIHRQIRKAKEVLGLAESVSDRQVLRIIERGAR